VKISLAASARLPGCFVIEAETPEDVLILRSFCNYPTGIKIASSGGNIGEGRFTVLIAHEDADEKPAVHIHFSPAPITDEQKREIGNLVADYLRRAT
jgi:hypothetical protein